MVRSRAIARFPPDSVISPLTNLTPKPVSPITPITIPAQAQVAATSIIPVELLFSALRIFVSPILDSFFSILTMRMDRMETRAARMGETWSTIKK